MAILVHGRLPVNGSTLARSDTRESQLSATYDTSVHVLVRTKKQPEPRMDHRRHLMGHLCWSWWRGALQGPWDWHQHTDVHTQGQKHIRCCKMRSQDATVLFGRYTSAWASTHQHSM